MLLQYKCLMSDVMMSDFFYLIIRCPVIFPLILNRFKNADLKRYNYYFKWRCSCKCLISDVMMSDFFYLIIRCPANFTQI
jgi:hypothetical protein